MLVSHARPDVIPAIRKLFRVLLKSELMCLTKDPRWEKVHTSSGRRPSVPLERIADAPLVDVDNGNVLNASELWRETPCVFLAFRRPGCGALPNSD